jgi:hypothetical protein
MTGAIVACALNRERLAVPRYVGKATITSDGWVMCDFVDSDHRKHLGAFVGGVSDLEANVRGLARHCRLNSDEQENLFQAVRNWIAQDARSGARRLLA